MDAFSGVATKGKGYPGAGVPEQTKHQYGNKTILLSNRLFHGTVDMQILQANKTANAFDDIGSTITRLVLLSDYDDGGRLTIAHVLTEKERIKQNRSSRILEDIIVKNIGFISKNMFAIDSQDSIFVADPKHGMVRFLPQQRYMRCGPTIQKACALHSFPALGSFNGKGTNGITYMKRHDGLLIYQIDFGTVQKKNDELKIFFHKHPDWNSRNHGFGYSIGPNNQLKASKNGKMSQEVATLPKEFSRIVSCVENGMSGSPFVYCAGGGWEVDKKAFIIRIQLPDLHDVKHFGKKPTNEWIVLVRLRDRGPIKDMIWGNIALRQQQDGVRNNLTGLYTTVAAYGGSVIYTPILGHSSCPPPKNMSVVRKKFNKFKKDTHLIPCSSYQKKCSGLGESRTYGVNSLTLVNNQLYISIFRTEDDGGKIVSCDIASPIKSSTKVITTTNLVRHMTKDKFQRIFFVQKDSHISQQGTLTMIENKQSEKLIDLAGIKDEAHEIKEAHNKNLIRPPITTTATHIPTTAAATTTFVPKVTTTKSSTQKAEEKQKRYELARKHFREDHGWVRSTTKFPRKKHDGSQTYFTATTKSYQYRSNNRDVAPEERSPNDQKSTETPTYADHTQTNFDLHVDASTHYTGNGILPYNSESESTAHNNGMGAGLRAHSSQQRQENSKKYDKDLAESVEFGGQERTGSNVRIYEMYASVFGGIAILIIYLCRQRYCKNRFTSRKKKSLPKDL